MKLSIFLKRVLLLDAVTCLGTGVALVLGTDVLAPLFGLDAGVVRGAGLALLPIGLFMAWLGTRQAASAWFVHAVIAGNLAWTVKSFLLIGNAEEISPIGTAFVAAQAVAVAALALLEWVGLRKSSPATA